MPTEAQCSERRMDDRREFFGAVGERLKARVFWIIASALIMAGCGLAGVLYACTVHNRTHAEQGAATATMKAEKAMDKARNNEVQMARIEQLAGDTSEQAKRNGEGIDDIKATLREMARK